MQSVTVHIDDSGLCSLVMENNDGTKKKRTVTYTDLLDTLVGSTETTYSRNREIEISPIFPGDHIVSVLQTKSFGKGKEVWYILLRQAVPADFEFFGTVYKKVGLPKMLFAVKTLNDMVVSFRVMAVKDYFITQDTILYAYPFSNVSTNGIVCTGNNYQAINSALDPENVTAILSIPEMFLAMPNSEHSYGHNQSGLYYRDMLEELQGVPFREEWLKDSGLKYKDFVRGLN